MRCWIISISPSVKNLVSFLSSHTLTRADTHRHTHAHAQMTKGTPPKEASHGQDFGHCSRTDESCSEVGRTAVERDLWQHSLRRAVVIDPDPGDLSGRRGPHVYRCDREMGAAGRRKQQLRVYVDGQTAGQARTNSMGGKQRQEEKKKRKVDRGSEQEGRLDRSLHTPEQEQDRGNHPNREQPRPEGCRRTARLKVRGRGQGRCAEVREVEQGRAPFQGDTVTVMATVGPKDKIRC